ncbi:MAG: TA system VapC family ribonuclease toxin [Candidatus Methylacidiphilales bacterium]
MILPDANLLLYAYDAASPHHPRAKKWWELVLSGDEPVGLCAAVVMAFIRLGTHPRVFENPFTVGEASGHIRSWLKQPICDFIIFEEMDFQRSIELLEDAGTGGNLTTDSQLAALALRLKATVYSADTDFARFPKLRWVNPLDGAAHKTKA